MKKPLMFGVSALSERVYAFRTYKTAGTALVVTGTKEDVTDHILALLPQLNKLARRRKAREARRASERESK